MHKVGDIVWRGYARRYDDRTYWPEIRPGQVTLVHDDGTIDVNMMGVVPGCEGKRNPGGWVAWHQPPERYHLAPEAALVEAKATVEQASELAGAA